MKIKQVAKLKPETRFFYWIRERHAIFLRRQAGEPKPWTDDEILQRYFFTNPYRENDKVTIWFRENIRGPLKTNLGVVFATICFRWFNFIPTGEILLQKRLHLKWDQDRCKRVLKDQKKIFTGAFMINSPGGEPKLQAICRRINNVWRDRKSLEDKSRQWESLKQAHRDLTLYEGLGGFMAYEVVTDLRHTKFLEGANDIMTWCNPGPGCARGYARLQGKSMEGIPAAQGYKVPKDFLKGIRKILAIANKKLKGMPPLEMREIEHSLCEWDKYERARLQDGRMKRTYPGV